MKPPVKLTVVRQPLDLPGDGLAGAVGSWPEPALLVCTSLEGDRCWSILAAWPRLVYEATVEQWSISTDTGWRQSGSGDPLEELARLTNRFNLDFEAEGRTREGQEACPFQGGFIGFLGYDLAPILERLPRRAPRDSRLPDIRMALYDTAVTIDHSTGEVTLHAWDLTGEGREALERRCRWWRRSLRNARLTHRSLRPLHLPVPTSDLERGDYLGRVRRALEYIAAGDIFQVNLSHRFTTFGTVEPLALFQQLSLASPAPHAAFLQWRDLAVASASPELFFETWGNRIITRPIKGTRPRGLDPAEDRRLAAELAASAKDRAELTMIVDLERNDLGRVCEYGSVNVAQPLCVESFAQVHHLVATVEGKLRPDVRPVDVIRALFPGGSITGAPKIRAMEIIDELEPTRRSLYTGAIGYLSRGGALAFNIAIRTLLIEGHRVSYQVGGGIVADSDPATEYEETLAKGRGLQAVFQPEKSA